MIQDVAPAEGAAVDRTEIRTARCCSLWRDNPYAQLRRHWFVVLAAGFCVLAEPNAAIGWEGLVSVCLPPRQCVTTNTNHDVGATSVLDSVTRPAARATALAVVGTSSLALRIKGSVEPDMGESVSAVASGHYSATVFMDSEIEGSYFFKLKVKTQGKCTTVYLSTCSAHITAVAEAENGSKGNIVADVTDSTENLSPLVTVHNGMMVDIGVVIHLIGNSSGGSFEGKFGDTFTISVESDAPGFTAIGDDGHDYALPEPSSALSLGAVTATLAHLARHRPRRRAPRA